MVLNTGPLDWESRALTTKPLLHVGLAPVLANQKMPGSGRVNSIRSKFLPDVIDTCDNKVLDDNKMMIETSINKEIVIPVLLQHVV